MKRLALLGAALLAVACVSTGPAAGRLDWSCSGGAAFSVRPKGEGHVELFAAGQIYVLAGVANASGARYADGHVEYWDRGGEATLSGAAGGPYENCRRS